MCCVAACFAETTKKDAGISAGTKQCLFMSKQRLLFTGFTGFIFFLKTCFNDDLEDYFGIKFPHFPLFSFSQVEEGMNI